MEKTDKLIITVGILSLFLILIIIYSIISQMDECPRGRWDYTNHCDALCYGEYGDSPLNHYHTEKDVIPLDDNHDRYICICDGGNITTGWTCM